jgi:hypothetical protein
VPDISVFIIIDDEHLIDCPYKLSNQFQKGYKREPHNLEVKIIFEEGKSFYEEKDLDDQEIKLVVLRKVTVDGLQAITDYPSVKVLRVIFCS